MNATLSELDLKTFAFIQKKLGITLNEGQQQLALPSKKPKLCSAVPGSGKTTSLGIGVACEELIGKVPGNKIQVMTFTNKATNEFKFRHMNIMTKLGLKSNVAVNTIHAMCKKYVEIFHEKIGIMSVETMDEDDATKLLQRVIATILDKKEMQVPINLVNDVASCIGFLNNKLFFKKEQVVKTYQFLDLKMDYEQFNNIRSIYQSSQRRSGKLTYDEWMLAFYEILKKNEDIRGVIQSQLQSIFVDEFQDTTKLQFEIIKMMKSETASLTAVGDADQSVYRWRGASNVYQLFIEAYPDYEQVKMDINYRCPDYVIDSSNALIRNNTNRIDIKARGTGKKGKLEIIATNSNQASCLEVAKLIIEDYMKSGKDNNVLIDKLVLYRNHSQGMFLVYELASRSIPVNTGGVLLPHKDKIVKDLLDIVYFLDNPRSSSHASKCMHMVSTQINKPKNRDICPFYTSTEQEHFAEIPVKVRESMVYKKELENLVEISKMIRERKPACQIFERLLPMYMSAYYLKYDLPSLMGKTDEDVESIKRFLLSGVDKTYDTDQFRHVLIKVEQFINESNKDNVGLKIFSIHGAKGLEAKEVYLLDVNGMVQPNPKVMKTLKEANAVEALEDYINEERSLMFVAMTRTLKDLYVTYNKDNPSPFNWESGLNDSLRAKKGVLTLERLGIKTNKNNEVGEQMKSTQNQQHPFKGSVPDSLLGLFDKPVSTETQTLEEITKIAGRMETSVATLERRKIESKSTRLEGVLLT